MTTMSNQSPVIAPDVSPTMPARLLEFTTISPEVPQDHVVSGELLTIPAGTVIRGDHAAKLTCSIIASVDRTSDGVVIGSVLFDEDGYGWSYEAAWDDFLASLRDKYASLTKRESILSAADRQVLQHLRSAVTF